MNQTDPTAAVYDALAGLQGGPHHLPSGTRQAIAEHLAATLPASAVVAPSTDRADLRDRVAAALYERERPPRDPHWPDAYAMDRETFEAMADAVLAVLPEQTDRAAVLESAANEIDRTVFPANRQETFGDGVIWATSRLRRLAVEAHDTGTQQQADRAAIERAFAERLAAELKGCCSECDACIEIAQHLAGKDEPAPVAQQPAAEVDDYGQSVTAAPTPGAVAAMRALLDSDNPPRRKVRTAAAAQQAAAADGEETQS